MPSFSEQRGAIRQALISAGLSQDAASQIANILGNSAIQMRHAGPIELDSTPPGFGFVGPQDRKVRFPSLDNLRDDPDHRPSVRQESEERAPNKPEQNVNVIIAPQVDDAKFRVAGGAYTEVIGGGDTSVVNVRSTVAGQPPAGLPLAMLSPATNQIVGKSPRAQVNANDGTVRFDIQQVGGEVLWNLQLLNRGEYDVVTGVEFVEGVGLVVSYAKIKAWDMAQKKSDVVPTIDTPVVTQVIDDKDGLRAHRRSVAVLGSRGMPTQFINTFRIGHFTGGWQRGTTKVVTQVWPESNATVDVMNMTQTIADTPSQKYVLYSVRTEDIVPDTAAAAESSRAEVKRSSPTRHSATGEAIDERGQPAAKYYSISIQAAEECEAFSSLSGKRAQELAGYDSQAVQVLSHDSEGCLKWVSAVQHVFVTDVEYNAVSKKLQYHYEPVLAFPDESGGGTEDILSGTDCPPETGGGA